MDREDIWVCDGAPNYRMTKQYSHIFCRQAGNKQTTQPRRKMHLQFTAKPRRKSKTRGRTTKRKARTASSLCLRETLPGKTKPTIYTREITHTGSIRSATLQTLPARQDSRKEDHTAAMCMHHKRQYNKEPPS